MAKINVTARHRREMYSDGYESIDPFVDSSGESFVQQSDYERSDINLIVERFIRTGVLESVKQTQGMYGDFSDVGDYHSALNQVRYAEESFMTLPATVRAKFQNDPGQFLDFINNPSNEREMYEMGLFNADYKPSWQGVEDDAQASAGAAPTST